MAVVSVEPLYDGRTSRFEADGNRSYTQKLRVTTNSLQDGQITVQFAAGVPRIGLGWYVSSEGIPDYQAVCTRADVTQGESGHDWIVDCEFSTRPMSIDPTAFGVGASGGGGGHQPGRGGAADDPTLKPPQWSFTWEPKRSVKRFQLIDPQAYPLSYKGEPCKNLAGEFFDPLPEIDDGYLVLNYSRLQKTFDEDDLLKYKYAMNADEWKPFKKTHPPYSAQCLPIEVDPEFVGGVQLARVKFRFRIGSGKNFTWNPELVEQGFKVLKYYPPSVSPSLVDAVDASGQKVTEPVYLNDDGTEMPREDVRSGASRPVTSEMNLYPIQPFAPLKIKI